MSLRPCWIDVGLLIHKTDLICKNYLTHSLFVKCNLIKCFKKLVCRIQLLGSKIFEVVLLSELTWQEQSVEAILMKLIEENVKTGSLLRFSVGITTTQSSHLSYAT
jgi:hypothetical protein